MVAPVGQSVLVPAGARVGAIVGAMVIVGTIGRVILMSILWVNDDGGDYVRDM